MNNEYPREKVLDDDYPVHYGYWYVCDGVPRQCSVIDVVGVPVTVFKMRIAMNVGEVRNCDLAARGMM